MQAYRFALDLTVVQQRVVLARAGAGRMAHNWALARVKAVLDQRAAERSRIVSATVRRDGGRWFVAFTVEVERAVRSVVRSDSVVGVDVGICHLAVLSSGEMIENPRHLEMAQVRLRAFGRVLARKRGPDRRAGRRASQRWLRASVRLRKAHARVANLRRDGLHKLTTGLVREYGVVVVEDLNVAGMLRNRRLARRVADAGFGEIRRQLSYKTSWHGGRLVVADRWFPSSKMCSGCGTVKTKLACPSVHTPVRCAAWSSTGTATPH